MPRLRRLQKFSSPLVCTRPSTYLSAWSITFMSVALIPQTVIGQQRIGVNMASLLDVLPNFPLNVLFAPIGDYVCPNFSAAFQYANHRSLVPHSGSSDAALPLAEVHIARLAADKGLIYLHFAPVAAQLHKRASLHRKANAMEHEPSGFLGYTQVAAHFIAADPVLAVHNHPHRRQPLL